MVFGIPGNASIIIIILKNKLLRLQPMNLFLLNLAISDLLHLCTGPLLYLFKRNAVFTNYYLGEIGCLVTPFFRGTGKKLSDVLIYLSINPKYSIILLGRFTWIIYQSYISRTPLERQLVF